MMPDLTGVLPSGCLVRSRAVCFGECVCVFVCLRAPWCFRAPCMSGSVCAVSRPAITPRGVVTCIVFVAGGARAARCRNLQQVDQKLFAQGGAVRLSIGASLPAVYHFAHCSGGPTSARRRFRPERQEGCPRSLAEIWGPRGLFPVGWCCRRCRRNGRPREVRQSKPGSM